MSNHDMRVKNPRGVIWFLLPFALHTPFLLGYYRVVYENINVYRVEICICVNVHTIVFVSYFVKGLKFVCVHAKTIVYVLCFVEWEVQLLEVSGKRFDYRAFI